MYPPPPVYHPQQQPYRPNRPSHYHPQSRPQNNPNWNGDKAPRHLNPRTERLPNSWETLQCQFNTQVQNKPMTGPLPKNYDPDTRCAYHMNAPMHDTKDCWALRHKGQHLIESEAFAVSPPISLNIGTNPLSAHGAGPSYSVVIWFSWRNFSLIRHSLLALLVPQFGLIWKRTTSRTRKLFPL